MKVTGTFETCPTVKFKVFATKIRLQMLSNSIMIISELLLTRNLLNTVSDGTHKGG